MEVANACFQKGSDVAHEAQCYFLGLLAGKECNLAGGSGGDQMIDRACMAMKKTREEYLVRTASNGLELSQCQCVYVAPSG